MLRGAGNRRALAAVIDGLYLHHENDHIHGRQTMDDDSEMGGSTDYDGIDEAAEDEDDCATIDECVDNWILGDLLRAGIDRHRFLRDDDDPESDENVDGMAQER